MSGEIKAMSDAIKSVPADHKLITHLEGENAVLLEKLRQVERELARVTAQRNAYQVALGEEQEACAKVAEEYKPARTNAFDFEDAFAAANSIATLIRGRGEK